MTKDSESLLSYHYNLPNKMSSMWNSYCFKFVVIGAAFYVLSITVDPPTEYIKMIDIFGPLINIIKGGHVCVDNNVFTLHYRLTVVILVAFSLIVGARKYFGDPIDCTSNGSIGHIVDNYCWFNSYIILPRNPEDKYGRYDRYEPVINEDVKSYEELKKPDNKYKASFLHAYQWVEFIFFTQAVLFFLPRYLWRHCWEQGRVRTLTKSFTTVSLNQESDRQHHESIIKYFRRNKFDHFEYAWKFIICEILNLANVTVQFFIIKRMFGLDWVSLQKDFFSTESAEDPKHPLNRVFPNLARCQVPSATGAGHALNQELCVLPVNVLIAKMYIFQWFFFFGLMIISAGAIVYRFLTLISPQLRLLILKRTGRQIPEDCVLVIRNLSYGDWFVLCLVGKNMDPFSFQELVKAYGDAIVASRPSFSLVGNEKLYNPDLAAMHMRRQSSVTPTPKQ